MAMSPERWKEVSPSEFPWEREALEYIRQNLPDSEPYRAWSNFEFIANDGTINEVDLLLCSPAGFFMIEIKSRPGHLRGDSGTWTWVMENGHLITVDSPLFLVNKKAKKLASMFRALKPRPKARIPFLEALVFCSAKDMTCSIGKNSLRRICFHEHIKPKEFGAVGILKAVMHGDLPGVQSDGRPIDGAISRAIATRLDKIGVRRSQKFRKVGEYKLEKLLFECPKSTYQDWSAVHTGLKKERGRVRVYNVALKESQANKKLIHKAAEREFCLLRRLRHDGILSAEDFKLHERGPALVYPYDPKALRLDHYLTQYHSLIGIDIRLSLIRQLAEAVKYAHGKNIIHRALSPQSIWVAKVNSHRPKIAILNWQAGRRVEDVTSSDSSSGTATLHPDQLMEDASLIYMAPECLRDPSKSGDFGDVFSLGATAFYILTGIAPAKTVVESTEKLAENKGFDISSVMDGAGRELCELIYDSTRPEVHLRCESASQFLDKLHKVELEFAGQDEEFIENPLDAHAGDKLEGGFLVKERLGKGGSATVFLVQNQDKEFVLKLANRTELNDRLHAEYEVLQKLRHPLILEVYDEVDIGGFSGFTMQAVSKTLAQRLREEGNLQLEFLQRFGTELLQIVEHLEDEGVYHRDIKPDNIGIGLVQNKKKLRLLLFDFSLSSIDLDNIQVGTPRYQDPFLSQRQHKKWDPYAERFSAALTLYEMTTGTLPIWGDGQSDPALLECEVTLVPERFDANIRETMIAFFVKALKREYRQRHDNAEEMRSEWEKIFRKVGRVRTGAKRAKGDRKKALTNARKDTLLASLGLSPQAENALHHSNIVTVGDILQLAVNELRFLRGVGSKTRNEIIEIRELLQEVHPDDAGYPPSVTAKVPQFASIDAIGRVINKTGNAEVKNVLHTFLGLEKKDGLVEWPGINEITEYFQLDYEQVLKMLETARARWRKTPAVTCLRNDIELLLQQSGGIMGLDDLLSALLAARGSVMEGEKRRQLALAVCRATIETEQNMQEKRFGYFRGNNCIFVSTGQEVVEYAEKLGDAVDNLAQEQPLPGAQKVIETLHHIVATSPLSSVSDGDLLRLAVHAAQNAALSPRLEIYPRGMSATRALSLARGSLAGLREITAEEIARRVYQRYPESEPIPRRPRLDKLLQQAGVDLQWNPAAADGKGAYCFKHSEYTISTAISSSSSHHIGKAPKLSAEEADVRLFERKLHNAEEGAFLVLSTYPRDLVATGYRLRQAFDVDYIDFDELFIPLLKKEAKAKKVKWEVVLRADTADKEQRDWRNLQRLVDLCLPKVESKLCRSNKTVLMTNLGLLARYERLGLLEKLRDQIGTANGKLVGLWLLIPSGDQESRPMIDGQAIPILGSGQHTRIPRLWLKKGEQ